MVDTPTYGYVGENYDQQWDVHGFVIPFFFGQTHIKLVQGGFIWYPIISYNIPIKWLVLYLQTIFDKQNPKLFAQF